MVEARERPAPRVEGTDDTHVFRHLLIRHGFQYGSKSWPDWYPSIESAGGKTALLKSVETTISLSSGLATGFVLDANASLRDS